MSSEIKKHKEIDIDALKAEIKNGKQRQIFLLTIFIVGVIGFTILINFSPTLTKQEKNDLYRIPTTPREIKKMNEVIQNYTKDNFGFVLFAFCYLYIFLQSFSLPGPAILNILSGQLFGPYLGYGLICSCSTIGASASYGLSYSLAKGLILNTFPTSIVNFHKKVQKREKNLFFYMLFLRFAPVIPKLTINIASPIVGVPFWYFFFGSFFGTMPANFIHLKTGLAINELNDISNSFQVLGIMAALALLALLPTFFSKYDDDKDKKE